MERRKRRLDGLREMTDQYENYDYAWKTQGWNAQRPTLPLLPGLNIYGDPGLPDDVSKVLVEGEFLDPISGRGIEGTLLYRTSDILMYTPTNTQVMPGVQRVRWGSGRTLSILLPATDDPQLTTTNPLGWKYLFRLTVQGITREFTSALPSTPAQVKIWALMGTP